MKIGITGASGLIGTPLVAHLRGAGHEVVRFVRGTASAPDERGWDPGARRMDPADVADLDAVVHLAGAGIGDQRWTSARKQTLIDSRVDGTTTVAQALADAQSSAVLLSASGSNVYGDTADRPADETAPAGEGFLAGVCQRWEAATAPAERAGLRVVHLRSAPVLTAQGGALAKQLPIFKVGLGAPLGTGRQWFSWISLHDHLSAVQHLLDADVCGPVNLSSPQPVTNREFTRALGRALHRPTLPVPVPGIALRVALGQLAQELVLNSSRLEPAALQRGGFAFAHPDIDSALAASL